MISEAPSPALVRRNTILLAATLTCLSGMLQLVVAVSTITLVLVTGIESILGLGPAVFLASSAVAALPAGRAMDKHARIPVLATGCALGVAGCIVAAAGSGLESAPLVLLGFVMVGGSSGTVLLGVRPRPTCIRPSAARAASRTSSSGRSSARPSARSCSGRSSPAVTSTRAIS